MNRQLLRFAFNDLKYRWTPKYVCKLNDLSEVCKKCAGALEVSRREYEREKKTYSRNSRKVDVARQALQRGLEQAIKSRALALHCVLHRLVMRSDIAFYQDRHVKQYPNTGHELAMHTTLRLVRILNGQIKAAKSALPKSMVQIPKERQLEESMRKLTDFAQKMLVPLSNCDSRGLLCSVGNLIDPRKSNILPFTNALRAGRPRQA